MVNQKEYAPLVGPKDEKKKRGVSFKILFSLAATLALSSGGYHLLHANNNSPQSVVAAVATSLARGDDVGTNMNAIDAVINAPSVVAATTTLIRGGYGGGDDNGNGMTPDIVATVIAADRGAFAAALKDGAPAVESLAKAKGIAIDNVVKVVDLVLNTVNRVSGGGADQVILTNLTGDNITWYCYSTGALIKINTQYRSHMGPYTTIYLTAPNPGGWAGYGKDFKIFKDNKNPGYLVKKGMMHTWTGSGVSIDPWSLGKMKE